MAPERERLYPGHAEAQIAHGSSLTSFLIFCKRLSSEALAFDCTNPKATPPWLGQNPIASTAAIARRKAVFRAGIVDGSIAHCSDIR